MTVTVKEGRLKGQVFSGYRALSRKLEIGESVVVFVQIPEAYWYGTGRVTRISEDSYEYPSRMALMASTM